MPVGEEILRRGRLWLVLLPSVLAHLAAADYGSRDNEDEDAQRHAYDDGQPVVQHHVGLRLLQGLHARAFRVQVL